MNQIFNSRQYGEISVDFDKQEAYFIRDDLLATMVKDDYGYWLFAHPMWLTQFRIMANGRPLQLDVQEWRAA